MFIHYLKIALRSLGKYRMQNIISIVSLAVALFCFTINLYITRGVIEEDKWIDDQVLYVKSADENLEYYDVPTDKAKELLMQRPEVEAMVRFHMVPMSWNMDDGQSGASYDYFIFSDTTMLDVLKLKLVAGNWQSVCRTEAENCVVLAESFAKKQFGSAFAAIGKELLMQELGTVTVQAVVADLPYANSIANLQYSAGWLISRNDEYYGRCQAWVKIRDGVDPDDFSRRFNEMPVSDEEIKTGNRITIGRTWVGRRDITTFKESVALIVMSLPGILILVVALFNYFHLLVNSILSSRREYALRRVHGARTVDMWKMVSVQIIFTTILTGILSLIIARYVTPMIKVTGSMGSSSGVTVFFMDTNAIIGHTLQYIILLVAAGLLIAWLAVIRVRRAEMNEMIKRHYGGRNFMLGVQLTVAQLTVTMLVAMFLKMKYNLTEPYSWLSKQDKTCIITDRTYGTMNDMAPEVEYLKSLPYVTHVTTMFREYLTTDNTLITEYTATDYRDPMNCVRMIISPELLDMFGVEITEGRMPERSNEILIDDRFTERFGLNVGDTIRVRDMPENYRDAGLVFEDNGRDWIPLVITGHIDDRLYKVDFRNMGEQTQPQIYTNWKVLGGYVVVRCLPGHQKETRAAIMSYHNPDFDVDRDDIDYYKTPSLLDILDRNNSVWNSIGFIAWIVAIIAFIITLLGVYSAISIDTMRRRKEMALRKINGALTSRIVMLFTKLYIRLFVISSAISIPVSAFLIKHAVMSDRPFEASAGSAILFYLCIALIMVVFVGLTIGFKIYRISRENPADVIKSE